MTEVKTSERIFDPGFWVEKGEEGRGDVSKMRIGGPTNWVSSK